MFRRGGAVVRRGAEPPRRRRGSPWKPPWPPCILGFPKYSPGIVHTRTNAHTHHTHPTHPTLFFFFFFFNKSTVILAPGPTRSAAAWAPQELSLTCICVPRRELVQSTRVWPPFWRRGSPWSAVLAPWFAVLAKIDGWTPFGLGRRP